MYILDILVKTYRLLSDQSLKKFISLQVFYSLSALVQVFGVASIGPFVAIVSNPGLIHDNAVLSHIYAEGRFSSDQDFIVAFAGFSLCLIMLSNGISALTYWLSFRFSVHTGTMIQNELFSRLLRKPFLYHKTTDHAKAIAMVNLETPRFVFMVLQPLLILISQLFVAAVILLGLLILNPIIALSAGALVGGAYLITYLVLRRALNRHGKVISLGNEGVTAILAEAFIGVKEIKLRGNEATYISRFSLLNQRGLASSAFVSLAGELPKLVIETISFGAILLLAVVLLDGEANDGRVVALLSLYALAGYKLLPTLQQAYRSISNISANGAIALKLAAEFEETVESDTAEVPPIAIDIHAIGMRDVSFTYPGATDKTIDDLSLVFSKGTLNTIAGPSGSGKSTLADIMLGLLPPDSGSLTLNGQPLENNSITAYQLAIGYVPQHIFLSNDTIVANVAFGVPSAQIDLTRVTRALAMANAEHFVNALPAGIDTPLGQDGKLLSGGQRQKIGIARALYQESKILILDEPTSALDIASEHEVMMTLKALKNDILIVVISHRPTAIRLSDNITLLNRGVKQAGGSFAELKDSDPVFQNLLDLSLAKEAKPAEAVIEGGGSPR